jgi:hypothetical protein
VLEMPNTLIPTTDDGIVEAGPVHVSFEAGTLVTTPSTA